MRLELLNPWLHRLLRVTLERSLEILVITLQLHNRVIKKLNKEYQQLSTEKNRA